MGKQLLRCHWSLVPSSFLVSSRFRSFVRFFGLMRDPMLLCASFLFRSLALCMLGRPICSWPSFSLYTSGVAGICLLPASCRFCLAVLPSRPAFVVSWFGDFVVLVQSLSRVFVISPSCSSCILRDFRRAPPSLFFVSVSWLLCVSDMCVFSVNFRPFLSSSLQQPSLPRGFSSNLRRQVSGRS